MHIHEFQNAMRASGLNPPHDIEIGKIHRFPGIQKNVGNRAGWCFLFDDCKGGVFGDWSTGLSETWQARHDKSQSKEERAILANSIKAAKAKRQDDRKDRQINAANRATLIWNSALPAPRNHPYLILKNIQPHNARSYKNALMLPVLDFTDRITSLQFITADGRKLLLSGGRKRGCFTPVSGNIKKPSRVIICEGWATGSTLAEDDPAAQVLAAIDAGNLEPVAVAARHRWHSTELIIAGDDDRLTAGNPGATKAKVAAIASGALLALPQWPEDAPKHLTDFNDLANWVAGVGT